MVYEYLKGAHSPWQPYFSLLPAQFDSLMFWSEEELQYLEGSAVVEKIGKESADSTFSELLIPIIVQHADLFHSRGRSHAELLALCHRMGSTIMSYAFDLEKPETELQPAKEDDEEEWEEDENSASLPKGMIPLADMLNADADRNNAKLFYEDDKVVMKTLQPVRAGDELYNDFGPLPRADLLRRYGFVTARYAPYDVVELASASIRELCQTQLQLSSEHIEEKWRYAEEQGLADDAFDISRADNGEEDGGPQFPEELCVLLNLLVTPRAEFDALKKKGKLPNGGGAALTGEAKRLLRAVLVRRYAAYRPDSSLPLSTGGGGGGGGDASSARWAMAEQVISGEKQVLREAIAAVSEADVDNKNNNNKKKRSAETLEDEANAIRQPSKK